MAKDDKMARDIKATLKRTFSAAGRLGPSAAKLFLASGTEYFKNELPAPVAMFETNKDILSEFWRSLRNPSDAANRYSSRIMEGETYKQISKFAKNAIDDLKTGNLYDKDRTRQSFFEAFNDMDDFGGFDMTGFDENGDWSEPDDIPIEDDVNFKVAAAQEETANERTEATIDAVSSGAEAIILNNKAIASNELRIGMKQHSQLMLAMQNMITQQSVNNEAHKESINAVLNVVREVNSQQLEVLNSINEKLDTIVTNTSPVKEERKYYDKEDIFGINGELDLKAYAKNIKNNIQKKFLFGADLSLLTGGFKLADAIDYFQDNPWQVLTDHLIPKIVPKSTKAQMEKTNRNISNFLPALLTKFADRGKKFEEGESDSKLDMLLGILGIEPTSKNTIKTESHDYLAAANFTNKTTRAIEEVIPSLLAKINSNISGDPLLIYNYKEGKFERASDIISRDTHTAHDLVSRGGSTSYEILHRAKAYNWESKEEEEKFQNYLYDFLQNTAEKGKFINPNPYKVSEAEFKKSMPGTQEEKDKYFKYITAILRTIPQEELLEMSNNFLYSRKSRERNVFDMNEDNLQTGRVAAWSGIMNPNVQKTIVNASKSYDILTSEEIDNLLSKNKTNIVEADKIDSTASTNNILLDLMNTLNSGIITYSYHLGNLGGRQMKKGSSPVTRQAASAIERLESLRKAEEDRIANEEAIKASREKAEQDRLKAIEEKKKDYNRPATELFVDNLDIEGLMAIQNSVDVEKYKKLTPEEEKAEKEKKKNKEQYKRYGDSLDSVKKKLKDKMPTGERFKNGLSDTLNMPFTIFEKGMKAADIAMMKILYGGDLEITDSMLSDDGEPFLFKTISTAVEVHFQQAADWFSTNIGEPLQDYMFNEENGLIPKIKDAAYEMFGVEEKKQWLKDKYKEYRNKAVDKFRGVKNEETGEYEGGLFSKQINQLNSMKSDITGSAYTTIQSSINRLLYGDYASTKGISAEYYFKGDDGKMHTGGNIQYHGVIGKLKQGFKGLQDVLFGEEDNPDRPTESRQKFNYVKNELSKAFPNMVVGAGAGMLASLFLPGGPLLGAIIGSSLGLVKGSEGLKTFLFGDSVEEDDTYIDPFTGEKKPRLGPDGKPLKKKSRKGNLISQDVYEGFKKFAPKVTTGAILGTLAGGLGLLPLGLGSTAGMVVGSMAGMIGASDQMKQLIFGKEGDDDSGLISKNFRKSVVEWGKKNLPTTMLGALGGGAAWHLISSVGLIPGLAMLPGGPILGFLGASVGLANADNIKDFLFGESEEVTDPETGKKTTKRQGGIFGRAFDTVRDKIMNPIARSFNFAGEATKDWFQKNIVDSMTRTMQPMKDALIDAGQQIEHAMKNIGNGIVEALFGKLDDVNSPRYKFHKFWNEKIMGKLKDLPNKIFGGIGKAIGFVLSSPFKAAEFIFTGKIGGKTLEQRKLEKRFKKRHKKEMKTGQYEYLEDEDSEWGILNMIKRAKRGAKNAFTTYSPDAMNLIRSGMSLNELEDYGYFDYLGDSKDSVRQEMYNYFGRKEDEENRHKTRSARAKLIHDLEGDVNKQQKLGLLPGQAVKGYMTDQDYMRGLGFDDRIVNTDWAKRNISIDTFLKEGGAPDKKVYQAWVKSKIEDEKKRFEKDRKKKARDEEWQKDEERWKLNALNRRRARRGLPPVKNLKDYDEAADILMYNYEGKTADNPDALLDENGHVIPEYDQQGNPNGLVKVKKKHWYDGIAKQFKADHIGPNRNESWMDSFTGYLDQYGSDDTFLTRLEREANKYTNRDKDKDKAAAPTAPEPTIPITTTMNPKESKAVVVKILDSQVEQIAGASGGPFPGTEEPQQSPTSTTLDGNITTPLVPNVEADTTAGAEIKIKQENTAKLPPAVKEKSDKLQQKLSEKRNQVQENIEKIATVAPVAAAAAPTAPEKITNTDIANLPSSARKAAREQQREEAKEKDEYLEGLIAGNVKVDRETEGKSAKEINDAADKAMREAKSIPEYQGAKDAADNNSRGLGGLITGETSKDNESFFDKLLKWLPAAGTILATIAGGIASVVSLVAGIGAGIGAIASGAADKAMHGVEVLAHGFLKRFGFSTMKGATFEDIGKVFTNAKAARTMSGDAAEASARNISKRAAKRNMATAKGLNRAARWADFFEAAGKAAKGDKVGLARMAEDASEKGLIGGLGMRMRQGLGKAVGTGAKSIGTGLEHAGEGLGKLGTKIADSGFVKAAGAAYKGNTAKVEALKYINERLGTRSATGIKSGEVVGKVFKTVKESFGKTLQSFFQLGVIKNTKFGKFGSRVANAILEGTFWTKIKEKFLSIGGKEASERVALKSLRVVPVLTLGFAIADFTIGMSKAKEYFSVFAGDVTAGMRFTAGVVNCLEGLIAAIPVPPVVPLLVSVALSFFTGEIAQAVYNAISDEDAKEELKKNQEALQQATDEYNKTHDEKLTTGEYAKTFNEDGSERTKTNTVKRILKSFFSLNVKNADDIAKAAPNSSHAALGGKGKGLTQSSLGAGGKYSKELCELNGDSCFGGGNALTNKEKEAEKKKEVIKEINSRIHAITDKKKNKNVNSIKFNIVDGSEKEEVQKSKKEQKKQTETTKTKSVKERILDKINSLKSFGKGPVENTNTKMAEVTEKDNNTLSMIKSKNSLGSGSGTKSINDKIKNITEHNDSLRNWGAGHKITPMSQHASQYNKSNRLMADAGCGPTSAAMVASAYGVKADPEQISNDSFAAGMRADDGGMNPKYFSQMANKFGSGFGMKQGPVDGKKIHNDLSAGRPVVMMGKGGPYGPTTHYMVAEGLSNNGKVKMIDPNNGSRKTVSGNNLIKNSTASVYSWGTGNGIPKNEHITVDTAFRRNRNLLDNDWGRGTSDFGNVDNTTTDTGSSNINIVQRTSYSLITKNARKEIRYIVLHYTTQTSSKAGAAKQVCDMWARKGSKGSADYVVDDAEIVQYNPDPSKHSSWHCGGGLQYSGKKPTSRAASYHNICKNSNSIGIEMSSNNSTGKYENDVSPNSHWYLTPATIANAARLTRYLMKKFNIPIENVIMHHDVTGKICPQPWCCNEAALAKFQEFKQQVMGTSVGSVGTSVAAPTGGTTSSGSTAAATQTNTKGMQMLDSISTLFNKFSGPFNTLVNRIMNTKEDISTSVASNETGTDSSGTAVSSGNVPSVTGVQGSKEDNAKYIYKFMKAINVPDDHIAAVLSNWTAESGIDPTGVETIYAPKYKMSDQKLNAMADPNAFSVNVMFPKYARSGIKIHKSAYKGDDGRYYPGIGLGGFTGPAVSGLLRKSQEINKPWYDLETQLRYMTDPSGSTYKRGKYAGRDWINNVFIPQKFSSPSQGAAWFEKNWEGSTFKQAEHMRTAQEWYNKIQSGTWGAGEGTEPVMDSADIDKEIAKVKPHEIDDRTSKKAIPETDTNWTPGWGAGIKNISKKINRNVNKHKNTNNIPVRKSSNNLPESDMDVAGKMDTKFNNIEPDTSIESTGKGRGFWGKGVIDNINTNVTNTENKLSTAKVKEIMAEWTNWNSTGSGGWAAWRNWPYNGRYHAGIDLHYAKGKIAGAPVKSFTSGVVEKVCTSCSSARGLYVVVKDEGGYHHIYQHLNSVKASVGQNVGIGQVIGGYGGSGEKGISTYGLHLHYEVRRPTAPSVTGGGYHGYMVTKEMLNQYCIDPRVRLAEYTGGKIASDSEGGTTTNTTTDSEGVSGTEGNVNEPSGLKFLSAVGTMFSKFASPFDNLINAIMNQGTSSSEDSSTSDSSTSSGGSVNVSGDVTSKDSALKYMYNYLSAMNVPDTQIAGVLSNFSMENGADPTSFEADYTKYPNTKYKADPDKLSVLGTGEKFPDWDSIDNWTRNVVWKKTKGIYKPGYDSSMPDKKVMGVGIGSWTGKVGEDFLNYAKSTGKPWYDMKTQMDYFTNSDSLTKNGYIAFDKKYRTKANMQEWWKGYSDKKFNSPTEAARWYFYNAEMPSGSASQAAQHVAEAQTWYDRIQQWKQETPSATTTDSTKTADASTDSSNDKSSKSATEKVATGVTNIAKTILGKGKGVSNYSFGKGVNEDVMDTIANNPIVDINSEFGAGTGTTSYNVEAVTNKIKDINKSLKKTNTITDVSTGFDNVSKLARRDATTEDKKDDTTAQILAFLTENIGTLIQYVSTIADRMPVQQKTTDVQKNLNNNKYSKLPTANANNMYSPTVTGNNSEDIGMHIMNSLTSK